MDPKTANQLDRLLADGELSGPEADAIFDRVYASVAAAEPRRLPSGSWSWMRAVVWGSGAIGACIAILFMLPSSTPGSNQLTARGLETHAPALEVRCDGGTLTSCPSSSKLVFIVSGEHTSGFLSAYAEPLDAGGERVWYFSREAESPRLVGVSDGTRVFDRAVKLGGSHRPGRYRIYAFVAPQPLSHGEMLTSPQTDVARTQIEISITGGP